MTRCLPLPRYFLLVLDDISSLGIVVLTDLHYLSMQSA